MVLRSVLAFRLAALPILLAGIAFLESQRPFNIFRLVTFILFFLLLADLTSLVRGKLRELLLIMTSLVFGLTVIEAAAEFLVPVSDLKTTKGLTVRQAVIGWGPQHAGRFHAEKIDPKTGRIIYDAVYTIDANLLRKTQSCEDCATIAFFGGSFTFGEGVNDADTLPQQLADSFGRRVRVLNLGFSGYGPQQFLRELETGRFDKVIRADRDHVGSVRDPHDLDKSALHQRSRACPLSEKSVNFSGTCSSSQPKLFIFLTAPFHVERTACKASWVLHGPRYALENGKIVYKGPCDQGPSLWLREWMQHMAPYRWLVEPNLEKLNHDDVDLYIRILLAAVHLAKEKYGVPTLVPYIRSSKDYLRGTGFTDDEIIKRLQDGGAMVVDATLAREEAAGAKIQIPGDGHPTPYANRLRAMILKNYIAQHLAELPAAEPKPASEIPHAMRE